MPTPDQFVAELPAALRKRVASLRRLVLDLCPDTAERVSWGGLSYFDAARGGPVSAGICQIVVRDGAVRLDFIHGASLPDPHGLLRCEEGRKAKRFVPIFSANEPAREHLRELVRAAAEFDPGNP